MVRSSHHLPLPSLPPSRVVLYSPFAPPPLSLSSSPAAGEVRRREPGAAISPHRIYRADPDPQKAYQYVNESPTGTTVTPLIPPPHCIYRYYIGGQISRMPATFFQTLPFRPWLAFSSNATPDEPHAPSRHSNYEFDTDAVRVSRFRKHTYRSPRECIYWLISPHHKTPNSEYSRSFEF